MLRERLRERRDADLEAQEVVSKMTNPVVAEEVGESKTQEAAGSTEAAEEEPEPAGLIGGLIGTLWNITTGVVEAVAASVVPGGAAAEGARQPPGARIVYAEPVPVAQAEPVPEAMAVDLDDDEAMPASAPPLLRGRSSRFNDAVNRGAASYSRP
eukprot:CAMPEP_0118865840 /NCGR_PEP_ID=MMETSP1163-20130328/9963_1 /TAXON_ID=124430 /ORGANISM="Phaeomonas parva, Strain CCMP2877" /LENGTH=154 /DNA_ID=CAMNT_0006800105 /DNA_START=1 /DNA_END=465 /DNA_ORIENTATION=+